MSEFQRIMKSNADALQLGKSLRDSGVNAMFMGDKNHESTAIEESMALTSATFKPGDSKQAAESLKVMQDSKAQYSELYEQTSQIVKDRKSDKTNDGMAENMANKIEAFHKEHGRMPRFTSETGDGHISGRNDVDEMVMQKLKDRGLPTEQYKNHKEVQFAESEKVDKVEVDKKLLGEHEYKVSVPATSVPDVRGQEQQSQSQGNSR